MKMDFTTTTVVKRVIEEEQYKDSLFSTFTDTTYTTVNGGEQIISVKKGIALTENIYAVKNTLDEINLCVHLKDNYYQQYPTHIVLISDSDFESVLNGNMHISQAVKYQSQIEEFALDGYKPMLFCTASYMLAGLDFEYISLPITFDDTTSIVTNETYDLEKVLEVLKQDEHVLNRENLKIGDIPYYNVYDEVDKFIGFKYLFTNEEYRSIMKTMHDSISLQYEVIKRLNIDSCKYKD